MFRLGTYQREWLNIFSCPLHNQWTTINVKEYSYIVECKQYSFLGIEITNKISLGARDTRKRYAHDIEKILKGSNINYQFCVPKYFMFLNLNFTRKNEF